MPASKEKPVTRAAIAPQPSKRPSTRSTAASSATSPTAKSTRPAIAVASAAPRVTPVAPVKLGSCETALAGVLHLAEALTRDNRESRGTLPSGRLAPVEPESESAPSSSPDERRTHARESLATALLGLEPELAIKLRTLMIAGRDGQSIGLVKVNLSLADAGAAFATMAADSSENGPLLFDYLRRGHALACASGLDLDAPLARWQSPAVPDLGERAWLSFGKQLAGSHPGDWECLGLVEQPAQGFSKLYLRLREHGWWSFRAVIDRPTLAGVEKERRELSKRRLKGVSASSLEAIAGRFAGVEGRALQRAGRAICARLGRAVA